MLILIEGIAVCFILLMVCTLVLKDGPEKCAVFHEEDVKKRVVELGYITEKELKRRFTLAGIGLFVPMLILVPAMVYGINGASGFLSAFWQRTAMYMSGNLVDRAKPEKSPAQKELCVHYILFMHLSCSSCGQMQLQ